VGDTLSHARNAAVALMVLDGLWLGLLMKNLYREHLARIVRLGEGRRSC